MADALWEGHTPSAHRHTQTTKVKTAYPPVSLRSLGRHKMTRDGGAKYNDGLLPFEDPGYIPGYVNVS